jgi:malate dehydrogenase
MYPDIRNTLVGKRSAIAMIESNWVKDYFLPSVQNRGGDVIKARKLSSAASAGNAALEHMREWILGCDDWTRYFTS